MIQDKLRFFRAWFKLMALIGLLAVAYTLIGSVFGRHGAVHLSLNIDPSTLPAGEVRIIDWSGGELLLLHRAPDMLARLSSSAVHPMAQRYRDDPDNLDPEHRGLVAEYLLVFNYGSAFRCPLNLVTPEQADQQGWAGGLVESCSGVRYDYAGRLLDGQNGQRHLSLPEQQWHNGKIHLP